MKWMGTHSGGLPGWRLGGENVAGLRIHVVPVSCVLVVSLLCDSSLPQRQTSVYLLQVPTFEVLGLSELQRG